MVPDPDEPTFVYYVQQLADVPTLDLTYQEWPYDRLVNMATALIRANGLTSPVVESLELLQATPEDYHIDIMKKTFERIGFLLQGGPDRTFDVNDGWGKALDAFSKLHQPKKLQPGMPCWSIVLRRLVRILPRNNGVKKTPVLLNAIGHDRFADQLISWLILLQELLSEAHQSPENSDYLNEVNHDLLRPLIWCAGFVNHALLNNALDEYAGWAYKKKHDVGSLSAKTGNACMYAFSLLPANEGVGRLTKFSMKIKNNTILKAINKIIEDVSKKNNISCGELEEMSVPSLGLDEQGILRMSFGDYEAVYTVTRLNEAELQWEKQGTPQKSLPVAVKSGYTADLKILKARIKEIESLLPVYKDKLEQTYLQQRSWTYEQWEASYIRHPLMAILAKN